MAASYPEMAILTLGKASRALQNATRGFLYIRKWHSSLREGKSLDRHMAASFYPEMAILTLGKASRV